MPPAGVESLWPQFDISSRRSVLIPRRLSFYPLQVCLAPNTFRRIVRRYDMLKPDAEAAINDHIGKR